MRALLLENDATQPRTHMETEEALRLTQFLLDRAGEGAFWTDPRGRFFYVNEAACSLAGYSREEMLALGVADTPPAGAGRPLPRARAPGPRGGPAPPSRWSTCARTASASPPR